MKKPVPTLVCSPVHADHRGWFCETYNQKSLAAVGITELFVQDNHSLSSSVGTIRGLHFQRPPHAQAKLVRCIRGEILDVAVDIRRGSPTYGKHVAAKLAAGEGDALFIPVGFAHGLSTLADHTEVIYKVSDFYAPECEDGLRWDDPALAIDWHLSEAVQPTISARDAVLPRLHEFSTPFVFERDDAPLGELQKVTQ
jgi:dTDP-4-dehydrorhamnose 3,5-epimerase